MASAVAEQDKEGGRGVLSTIQFSGKLQGLEIKQKASAGTEQLAAAASLSTRAPPQHRLLGM